MSEQTEATCTYCDMGEPVACVWDQRPDCLLGMKKRYDQQATIAALQARAEAAERERDEANARVQALEGFINKTVEEFQSRGYEAYRHHPEMTEEQALAYALRGWEWDWLQSALAALTASPAQPTEARE